MELTHKIVRELLDYNPRTGVVTWRIRKRKWFTADHHWRAWNTKYANKPAGSLDTEGYRQVTLFGEGGYRLGRLIWFWVTGEWPLNTIDHEDRDKQNNRWKNLRDVTMLVQSLNRVQDWCPARRQLSREKMQTNWLPGGVLRLAFEQRDPEKYRGENHPRAILTEDKVRVIRELYDQGTHPLELAEQYGVHPNTIYGVGRRVNWKHVV